MKEPLGCLLVTGQDTNKYHDLAGNSARVAGFLGAEEDIRVVTTDDYAALESPGIDAYTVVLLNTFCGSASPKQIDDLCSFVEGGKGLVVLHAGILFCGDNPKYGSLVGGKICGHAPYGDFDVTIEDRDQAVTQGMDGFRIRDELYDSECAGEVRVLATGMWRQKRCPVVWTKAQGRGRVCYLAFGHDAPALANAGFRAIMIRAVRWVGGRL